MQGRLGVVRVLVVCLLVGCGSSAVSETPDSSLGNTEGGTQDSSTSIPDAQANDRAIPPGPDSAPDGTTPTVDARVDAQALGDVLVPTADAGVDVAPQPPVDSGSVLDAIISLDTSAPPLDTSVSVVPDTSVLPIDASVAVDTNTSVPADTSVAVDVSLSRDTSMLPLGLCGDGIVTPGEACDDGNPVALDGCTGCGVDDDYYCYGAPSVCRYGSCVSNALTARPSGDFEMTGLGTYSSAGTRPTMRGTIRTSFEVEYPIVIEVDVRYSNDDITFIGSRGSGLPLAEYTDEPADSIYSRIHNCCSQQIDLATGPGYTANGQIFAPWLTNGVDYKLRYVDDGHTTSTEIWNPSNTDQRAVITGRSDFMSTMGNRAFIGGGHGVGVTFKNLRVCSAPSLPVTSGLEARYNARYSWTHFQDGANNTATWNDISGNEHHLGRGGQPGPVYSPGQLNGNPTMAFSGGQRLLTTAFPLNTQVTVFAVIQHRNPEQWGNIAHHGSRDNDWSLETNETSATALHWQSANDNSSVNLLLNPYTNYVLSGRIAGATRSFQATGPWSGGPSQTESDGVTISAGNKILYVGASDILEQSNAYISELVYYARALDDGERAAVTSYLRGMWLGRGPIFVEGFQPAIGGTNGMQCESSRRLHSSSTMRYWTGAGPNAIQAVQTTLGDYAPMFFDGSSLLYAGLIGANELGTTYTVRYRVSPSVWSNCEQATQAGDPLRVEVLRTDSSSVMASHNAMPGTWSGDQAFTRGSFSYVGDGTGPVRLRVSDPNTDGRFAGAIDDITIQAHP